MKAPWFSIVEVVELRGRSMADICADIAEEFRVTLPEMRGPRQTARLLRARRAFVAAVTRERPDLCSNSIGDFLNRDGSRVRQQWREEESKQREQVA